jgi:hypothetical protein
MLIPAHHHLMIYGDALGYTYTVAFIGDRGVQGLCPMHMDCIVDTDFEDSYGDFC